MEVSEWKSKMSMWYFLKKETRAIRMDIIIKGKKWWIMSPTAKTLSLLIKMLHNIPKSGNKKNPHQTKNPN